MWPSLLPPVLVDALAPLTVEDFGDLFSALDDHGVIHAFEQREQTMYASLDWIIPTGVVVAITHSYFDGILKEISKEHYQWFKGAVSSLYKKFLGPEPQSTFNLISAGKARSPAYFSGSLSFYYAGVDGIRVKLLFPLDVTMDDYTCSCGKFIELITAHAAGAKGNLLTLEVERQARTTEARIGGSVSLDRIRSAITLLVYWDRHSQSFHVPDSVASAKSSVLVSRILGDQ